MKKTYLEFIETVLVPNIKRNHIFVNEAEYDEYQRWFSPRTQKRIARLTFRGLELKITKKKYDKRTN